MVDKLTGQDDIDFVHKECDLAGPHIVVSFDIRTIFLSCFDMGLSSLLLLFHCGNRFSFTMEFRGFLTVDTSSLLFHFTLTPFLYFSSIFNITPTPLSTFPTSSVPCIIYLPYLNHSSSLLLYIPLYPLYLNYSSRLIMI